MAHFDLICKDCGHKFVVVTRAAIRDKQKRCPECESENIRQTFGSYLAERAALQPHLRRAPAQQRLRLRLLASAARRAVITTFRLHLAGRAVS